MSEYRYKQMGSRIFQRRKKLGFTQKEFARMINISNNHLSNIENGKSLPSFESFLKICAELKVSSDFIISGTIFPDINDEISLKIRKCSDEDKIKISHIIDVFLWYLK